MVGSLVGTISARLFLESRANILEKDIAIILTPTLKKLLGLGNKTKF